jgi:hypothetical protein
MYFFLILGLPLGFLLLVLREYPRNEFAATRKAFFRGIASSIPIWFAARLLGFLVPDAQGSFLSAFHEWADRLLPYAVLPALSYLVFFKPGDRIAPGAVPRRLTAFYAGALSPAGLLEATRIWGSPESYTLFLLPIFLCALCLAMPKVASLVYAGYGIRLGLTIAAFAIITLAFSVCPYLLLVRLWPIALLVTGAAGVGAWLFAYPELRMRPPTVPE